MKQVDDAVETARNKADDIPDSKSLLPEADQLRIQRFADKYDTEVHVV